jgi:hypothetical protein
VPSIGRSRPALLTLAGVLALAAVAAGCSRPPGNGETDRIAKVVADAISYPRQDSAAGFARAALATRAGRSGRLRLVAMEELPADDPQDPLARLVFLVRLEGSEGGFVPDPAVTACYEAKFNYYGIMGSPRRIACPPGATPITPPPAEPKPQIAIPDGADELIEQVLTRASRPPDAEKVHAALVEGLGKAAAAGREPPFPQVVVDGADVGVALWEPEGSACLLGARVGGKVLVWRPSRVQLQPGELSCDPETALARRGTRPPH